MIPPTINKPIKAPHSIAINPIIKEIINPNKVNPTAATGFHRPINAITPINKIAYILENEEVAIQLGKEGSKFIKEQFNWKKVAENFLRIIEPHVKRKS